VLSTVRPGAAGRARAGGGRGWNLRDRLAVVHRERPSGRMYRASPSVLRKPLRRLRC